MKKRYLFDEELLEKVKNKDELDFKVKMLNYALTELKSEFENAFYIDSKIEKFKDEAKVEELGYQLKRLSSNFKVYANEEDKAFLLITDLKDFDQSEIKKINNIEELKMEEENEIEDSNSEEVDKQGQQQANQFTDEQAAKLIQLIDGENLDALLALIADIKQEKEMEENETIDSKEESKDEEEKEEDEKLIDTKKQTKDSFASFNTIYNASNEINNEDIEDEISNAWKARKF